MDDKFPPEAPPNWLPYFAVTDVDATAATAQGAGGELMVPPTSVPDGPRIAVVRDPQGAVFGIYLAGEEGQGCPADHGRGRGRHPDSSAGADGTVHAGLPLLESPAAERRATLIATPMDRRTHRFDIRLHGAGETVLMEFS